MRVRYAPPATDQLSAAERQIYQRITARRGALGILPLDRALLHSFPIAQGWHTLFAAINDPNTQLEVILRKIAICRVALHCGATVQWNGHFPVLRGLIGPESLEVISTPNPSSSGPLSRGQWAVLRYADAMTKNVAVTDGVFAELAEAGLAEQSIVELTATIAGYNCVSRFLVALKVDERA